ncbi:TPA: restriction endonuclease subunit S [Candidatus Micrarchaeota archaeon]|nr:restriction endonuclease subunit S [Candidatus Micrarchaeota archaeon]
MRNSVLTDFESAPFDIIDGDRGKNYPKQNEFSADGHCLFLSATNVTKSGFDFSDCQFISEQKDTILRKGKLHRGDVVLTTRGTIGNSGYYSDSVQYDHMRINSGMVILRCDIENILPVYLYHFLRSPSFFGQVNSLRSGVAQPQLPIRDMRKIKLPLPPLDVQSEISSFISAYDDLIENNRRRIQLLEQAARLLYKEWFVHLRFPGHEHVKIKNGVPEGWEETFLPDVIDVNPKTPIEKGKKIIYVPMSALSESGMTANIRDFAHRTSHTSVRFKKNDVLLARITPCLENGKTGLAYFLRDNEVACGSTEFIVLRGKRVSHAFTYCLARSYPFRENAIKSMIGSSGRQRVQVSCFDEYKVPLPPKHLLEMFDEIVVENFEQIRVLMDLNDKLVKARDLLLPRLMNGEITP